MDALINAVSSVGAVADAPKDITLPPLTNAPLPGGAIDQSTIQHLLLKEADLRNAFDAYQGGRLHAGDIWLVNFVQKIKLHFTRELMLTMARDANISRRKMSFAQDVETSRIPEGKRKRKQHVQVPTPTFEVKRVKCLTRKDKTSERKIREWEERVRKHVMKYNLRGKYTTNALRSQRLQKYRGTRSRLSFTRDIKYPVRTKLCTNKRRNRGRFVKSINL